MSNRDTADGARGQSSGYGSTEAYIEHGHYYVMHADAFIPGAYQTEWVDNTLLYPAPEKDEDGGIFVLTGTLFGPVGIAVETYDSAEQAVPDPGDWEIVQEVDIVARGANLRVETDSGVEIDLPQLQLAPGAAAGVRLHARGYRKAVEAQEVRLRDGAIEHHLLQLWRA